MRFTLSDAGLTGALEGVELRDALRGGGVRAQGVGERGLAVDEGAQEGLWRGVEARQGAGEASGVLGEADGLEVSLQLADT